MADTPAEEQLKQDLGLGGRMSARSRSRMLNHDGEFNVRRNNLGPFHRYNAYHTLLRMSVPRLLALVAALYLGVNLLFASLYWLAGPEALAGADGGRTRFEDCFFFSVQTLATIGYGKLVPNTRLANALVSFEALFGLLGFAVLSGLLFARFTRPSAKVSFSDRAVIAPYGKGWALMFRLANLRRHDLTDVHAVVSLSRWVPVNGQPQRRFDLLALERTSIIFMPLHWVIVHPIDERSPLRGTTREEFAACDPELICLLSGHDETFAQTVHARISYDKGEIVWGARFRDIYTTDMDHVSVDLTRLSDYDEVDSPAAV
ncbi:MAG: ion channel [Vicinamibacterales bacterium]